MLQAALELAACGWAVFPTARGTDPVADPGKKPLVARGVHAATTDEKQIREWWARWPDANPAIAVPPNCVVLDVDPRKGGNETLARLMREHGAIQTLEVETAQGGRHLFFEIPEGAASNQVEIAPGLDTRAEGGYVIAAGSVNYGRPYHWLNDLPPAPAPAWLLAAARKKPANEVAAELIVRPFPAELEATRGAAIAQLLRDHVWRDGQKHATALAIGGYLHKRGFSWETVEAVVRSLPSRNSENRVDDARDAWNAGDGGAGYQSFVKLTRHAPEALAELERLTEHPKPLYAPLVGAASAPRPGPGIESLPSFADLVDALPEEGQDPEFRTGLDILDEKIDGGIREGNAVAIGAPPDGGKTQLLFQTAWNLARQGVACIWIAVDEEPRRLAERGLQTFCGATRAEARRPTKALRDAARREHAALQAPIVFSESPLIEEAFALVPELKRRPGVRAVAVIADSIQKVHVVATFGKTSEEMQRLNLVCDTARQLSRTGETRSMFLFSSEVSRTYYAIDSKGDPMGSFKGSSAIEYLATLALLLRPDHETNQVNVEIAKSKIGGGGQAFGLTRDGIRLVGARFVRQKQARVENDNVRVLGTIVEAGPINAVGGPMPVRVRDVLLQTMRRRDGKAIATGRLHKALQELKEQELIWFSPDSKQIVPTALGEAAWRRAKDPLLRSPELDGDSATE